MARKKKYPAGKPMLGVGALNDINPQNNNFVNELRNLINKAPEILANQELMKYLNLALFRANEGQEIKTVAKGLDQELAAYLAKNNFRAPVGLQKLRQAVQTYY